MGVSSVGVSSENKRFVVEDGLWIEVEVFENNLFEDPRAVIEDIERLSRENEVLYELLGDLVCGMCDNMTKEFGVSALVTCLQRNWKIRYRVRQGENAEDEYYLIAVTDDNTVVFINISGDEAVIIDASAKTALLIAKGLFYWSVVGGW